MGNNSSRIENQVKDIEGAMAALEKINDALARYRTNVYKNPFFFYEIKYIKLNYIKIKNNKNG